MPGEPDGIVVNAEGKRATSGELCELTARGDDERYSERYVVVSLGGGRGVEELVVGFDERM